MFLFHTLFSDFLAKRPKQQDTLSKQLQHKRFKEVIINAFLVSIK